MWGPTCRFVVELVVSPTLGGKGELVQIPIASVEPGDLVEVDVDGSFTIELRTIKEPFTNRGLWWLEAWGTIASIGAVTSPDGDVRLIQRRKHGDPEKQQHPHGWAFIYAGQDEMHYCVDTTSLCEAVVGYVGLTYPTWDPAYFDEAVFPCEKCLAILEKN